MPTPSKPFGRRVVTLVTPVYKPELTPTEAISLERALSVLAPYDHYLAAPQGLNIEAYEALFAKHGKRALVARFSPASFSSVEAYSHMLTGMAFYRRFRKYRYLLIYQLDCYVFRDELLEWCARGYDYIGAPWFEGFDEATEDAGFAGVGNGGFSLRRVSAARRALARYHLARAWASTLGRWTRPFDPRAWSQHFLQNEDRFWGLSLGPRVPGFRLPSVEDAIPFAFEVNPRRLFRMNGERLPFGCHACWRYDPAFWREFIPGAEQPVEEAHDYGGDGAPPSKTRRFRRVLEGAAPSAPRISTGC